MPHYEFARTAPDGVQLFMQGWEPESEPKGVVCLVHGLGEHSGRYPHLAKRFNQAGYAVISFDLRGHGKSGGPRGHAASFEALMDDIGRLLAEAEQRYPGKPRFLYGHSLGGVLVLNYELRRHPSLAGVIATSAGLRNAIGEQHLKLNFLKAVAGVAPTLALDSGLEVPAISRDPAVVAAYRQDARVHSKGSARLASEVFRAIDFAFEHAGEFASPLLLMHGTGDRIAYAAGSEEFAGRVKCDVTLKLWEGLYHETHNEPEQAQVFAYLLEWMERRAQAGPAAT